MRFLVVLLAIAACGDNIGPDLNEGARSGTRLRLRYYDFGSVRQLVGIHDAQRNENCYPQEWTDGTSYCTPASSLDIVFADAACTQPVGRRYVEAECTLLPPPAYFSTFDATCNYTTTHLYPRGTNIAMSQHWMTTHDGACFGPYPSNPSAEHHALGAEIPVTDLAAMTLTSPSTTGRLGQRHHESADGLRYPVTDRLHDAVLGGDCSPTDDSPGSGTGHCVPSNPASASYFLDAACTIPTARIHSSCSAPSAAYLESPCPHEPARYFDVLTKLRPATIHVRGLTCARTPPDPEVSYYGVGQELALAATTRTRDGSAGRVQPIYYTTPEGLKTRDDAVFDAQLGTECRALEQADGSVACVPDAAWTYTLYVDASCVTAIDLMFVHRGGPTCAPPPLPSYAIKYPLAPSCTHEVYRAGVTYSGPVFSKNGTTCDPYVQSDYYMYRLGAVVPQSDLAAGTLVTE